MTVPDGTGAVTSPPVARAETILRALVGIADARVIAGPHGEIVEVRVVSMTSATPRQVARNVESALLARLGLAVDHRRIIVAKAEPEQPPGPAEIATASREPAPAASIPAAGPAPAEPVAEIPPPVEPLVLAPTTLVAARNGRGGDPAEESEQQLPPAASMSLTLRDVEVSLPEPERLLCRVELFYRGENVVGTAMAPNSPSDLLFAAARATLDALRRAGASLERLQVDGVREVDLAGGHYVLASLRFGSRDKRRLAGAAPISASAGHAAAHAVLQAAGCTTVAVQKPTVSETEAPPAPRRRGHIKAARA